MFLADIVLGRLCYFSSPRARPMRALTSPHGKQGGCWRRGFIFFLGSRSQTLNETSEYYSNCAITGSGLYQVCFCSLGYLAIHSIYWIGFILPPEAFHLQPWSRPRLDHPRRCPWLGFCASSVRYASASEFGVAREYQRVQPADCAWIPCDFVCV